MGIPGGIIAAAPSLTAEWLSRPEIDSVALLTEPTLKAWGIPFDYLQQDSEVDKIPTAFEQVTSGTPSIRNLSFPRP
ncbi:MAG: hypothetical protein ACRD1R_09075 [Acidobacteriota bacterium]